MVNKDFALEPDDNRLRKAAQLMASSLAGRLALVTCKDPLRVTTSKYLREFLQRGLASKQLSPSSNLDNAIEVIAVENLELGCRLIEKAATDKANRDIHEAIEEILSARKKRRDAGHLITTCRYSESEIVFSSCRASTSDVNACSFAACRDVHIVPGSMSSPSSTNQQPVVVHKQRVLNCSSDAMIALLTKVER